MEDSGDHGEKMADISGVISIMFQVLRKVRLFIMLILLSFTGPEPIMPVPPSNPPPAFDLYRHLTLHQHGLSLLSHAMCLASVPAVRPEGKS